MLLTSESAPLAPNGWIERARTARLAPNGSNWSSWMRGPGEHGSWLRLGVRRGQGHLALYGRDAHVAEPEPERDREVLQHLPRLPERLLQRDRRPQELDAAFEVRVAALLLREGGGRKHHGGAIPLRSRQMIPGGEEFDR